MTEQEQRIAIAEACGWKEASRPIGIGVTEYGWLTPNGKWLYPSEGGPPDYLNDLNAMHEAEKVLTDEQWVHYIDALKRAVGFYSNTYRTVRAKVHTTATERAEAFLEAIGKRKE